MSRTITRENKTSPMKNKFYMNFATSSLFDIKSLLPRVKRMETSINLLSRLTSLH